MGSGPMSKECYEVHRLPGKQQVFFSGIEKKIKLNWMKKPIIGSEI